MNKHLKNRKGGTLAFLLIIMAVFTILGTVALRIAVAENNFSIRHENKIQAYYLARTGAQSIATYMIRDPHGDANDLINKASDVPDEYMGGTINISVNQLEPSKEVEIISVGEFRGVTQEVKIRMVKSPTGVGGIFKHAIAAVKDITASNQGGTNINIIGSVVTKEGSISLPSGVVITEGSSVDPTLYFPPIVPPATYDLQYKFIDLEKNKDTITLSSGATVGKEVTTTAGTPLRIRVGSPTTSGKIEIKNNTYDVVGNGIVHMYVYGDIDIQTQGSFNVASTAKLYIYVIGERTVKLSGRGAQNNIYLYAPDSHIMWNNAQPDNKFYGSIVGRTVELHNQILIEYNPDLVNDVDLDKSGVGVTYTGYTWID